MSKALGNKVAKNNGFCSTLLNRNILLIYIKVINPFIKKIWKNILKKIISCIFTPCLNIFDYILLIHVKGIKLFIKKKTKTNSKKEFSEKFPYFYLIFWAQKKILIVFVLPLLNRLEMVGIFPKHFDKSFWFILKQSILILTKKLKKI